MCVWASLEVGKGVEQFKFEVNSKNQLYYLPLGYLLYIN